MGVRARNVTYMKSPPTLAQATLNHVTAANIRAAMAYSRRTTAMLAEHLTISRQAASRKMAGTTAITVDEVDRIARWLDIAPATLLDRGPT